MASLWGNDSSGKKIDNSDNAVDKAFDEFDLDLIASMPNAWDVNNNPKSDFGFGKGYNSTFSNQYKDFTTAYNPTYNNFSKNAGSYYNILDSNNGSSSLADMRSYAAGQQMNDWLTKNPGAKLSTDQSKEMFNNFYNSADFKASDPNGGIKGFMNDYGQSIGSGLAFANEAAKLIGTQKAWDFMDTRADAMKEDQGMKRELFRQQKHRNEVLGNYQFKPNNTAVV
jgi:hypothetical protein